VIGRKFGAIAAAAVLFGAPVASGYIRYSFNYSDGSSAFIKRSDATAAGVQFYVNSAIAPGVTSTATGSGTTVITAGSNVTQAIRASFATWNNVSSSAARFLATQSTTKVIDPADGQNTIAIGSTASDLSALGFKAGVTPGAFAFTILTGASFNIGTGPTGDVSDTDIVINPAYTFSTDGSTTSDFQAVLTHELGHSLGLNHTPLVGATMFQFAFTPARYLSSDEIAFATAVYASRAAATPGTLAGKVVASDGTPVQSGLMVVMDTTTGNALGALTGQDGTWSLQVPAGSYTVYADAMTGSSLVQPGNLSLLTTTKVTSNFQASVLGGISSPTAVTVASGATVTAPTLTVTSGSSALTPPYGGIGAAGGSSDIKSVSNVGITVPSGQMVDIGLAGGGMDATISVQAIGPGVTVQPGTVRLDKSTIGGMQIVRVTLNVAARQTPSLASLIVTKGSSVLAMSGVLVLVPPTPKFTAAGVVCAASYKGPTAAGGVSPGGIYSIYDTTNNSLGPNPFVQPSGYDAYGNLATSLGGVTVTFDGIAAPLYLSYSGQLNFQAPFELTGKTSTQVVVNYYGSASAAVTVPVVPTQPAFFTFTPLGADAIAQNFPDYSLNSATNPIARGGIVLLYGTGLGNLGYPLATGQPGTVPPSSYSSKYSCSFGGQSASAYAYWNYGFVGEATWTVTVPSGAPTGAVTLTCTDSASGATTQQGTIYIK
jgi:uncharacterized protein (TIGR03437 family)